MKLVSSGDLCAARSEGSGAGDLDGDGFPDLGIVSTYNHNIAPRAYVVFGGKTLPQRTELRGLANLGFKIAGVEGEMFSSKNGGIAGGDLDGDGLVDLVIGEAVPDGDTLKKRAVVIFGRKRGQGTFVRGEANGDGRVNPTDPIMVLNYLFRGGAAPACPDAADLDDSVRAAPDHGPDLSAATLVCRRLSAARALPRGRHRPDGG